MHKYFAQNDKVIIAIPGELALTSVGTAVLALRDISSFVDGSE